MKPTAGTHAGSAIAADAKGAADVLTDQDVMVSVFIDGTKHHARAALSSSGELRSAIDVVLGPRNRFVHAPGSLSGTLVRCGANVVLK